MRARKKPVEIEARRFTGYGPDDIKLAKWCDGEITYRGMIIHTLEGDHLALPGDWIIKGVHGEFNPCKPDIFDKTYEIIS